MVDFVYQTLPARILAGFADGFICWGIDYFLSPLLVTTGGSDFLAGVWLSLIWTFYDITMTVRYGGTLGKLMCRIRIYHVSETSYLSVGQALMRGSVGIALNVIGTGIMIYEISSSETPDSQWLLRLNEWFLYANLGWCVLEILTALFNKKRRAIHDFIGSSVVKRTWGGKIKSQYANDDVLVDATAR